MEESSEALVGRAVTEPPTPPFDGFYKRYSVITGVFLLWSTAIFVLDDIYDLFIFGPLLILVTAAPVGLYLLVSFLVNLVGGYGIRAASVLGGVILATVVWFVAIVLPWSGGLNADYFSFLLGKQKYLADLSASDRTQPPRFWGIKSRGMFMNIMSMTVLAYDPSGQIMLKPHQRSEDWIDRARPRWPMIATYAPYNGYTVFDARTAEDYESHVSVRSFGDGFYLMTLH
jgi:hypothetical protein